MTFSRNELRQTLADSLQAIYTLLDLSTVGRGQQWVEAWRGHEGALIVYARTLVREFKRRRLIAPFEQVLNSLSDRVLKTKEFERFSVPDWFGDESAHDAFKRELYLTNPQRHKKWKVYTQEKEMER